MNIIEMLLTNPAIQTLGWTLIHFLWQGALVAILLACANILIRRRTANTRYAVGEHRLAAVAGLFCSHFLPVESLCYILAG